jgi:COP9 signalosome complex subunit 3
VRQVIGAFRRFSILKLEKTYVALYIREVARRTSPNPADYRETVEYVRSLIASGQLNATLVESPEGAETAVLRFPTSSHPGPQSRSEVQLLENLRAQTDRIGNLNDHVREIDRRLGLSKEYLDSAHNMLRPKDAGGYMGFNSAAPANDDYVADEDMMADL